MAQRSFTARSPGDKQALIVCMLGMHRSGTSLISGLLKLLGVYLGPEEHLMKPGDDNLRGFWEHKLLTNLDDQILARLGGSWHEPPAFTAGWERLPELEDLRQRARAIIENDFSAATLWGWKDPRTCLVLPFWQQLLPPMRYVISMRNPLDVAQSLSKRNGFTFEQTAGLWLSHVTAALHYTKEHPRLFISYEDIMQHPQAELQRLTSFLGIPQLSESPEIQRAVRQFIDRELHHYNTSIVDVADDSRISYPAKALYVVLRQYANLQHRQFGQPDEYGMFEEAIERFSIHSSEVAKAQDVLRSQMPKTAEQVQAMRAQLRQAAVEHHEQVACLKHAVAKCDDQIAHLNHTLVQMRRSNSWRLTAPLRFAKRVVSGEFIAISRLLIRFGKRAAGLVPENARRFIQCQLARLLSISGMIANSTANSAAIAAIVAQRCIATQDKPTVDPLTAALPANPPDIDISVVTHNSERWVARFVDSLIALDYQKSKITVCFVDHESTDATIDTLNAALPHLRKAGYTVDILRHPNRGCGAGHNVAIQKGHAPFCLVTNVDLVFERDALACVVATALADERRTAAWELRQKPYEHPKFYDPVTGITNWNSHACVLLRRDALERVGYYDETLFVYGEDVELSYRLRRAGFILRYCPRAVVWHYTYERAGQVKPIQYVGSTFSNLYLRLKYGNFIDMLAVLPLGLRLLLSPQVYRGSRRAVLGSLMRLTITAPKALLGRRVNHCHFPFRTWDYELTREGEFVEQRALPANPPLVSVITRTYRGRELHLRQALLSVAHQTYPNIEHIVVEDGGHTLQAMVAEIGQTTGQSVCFIGLPKHGRSATGNAGLAASNGRWCLFLDDDDLLFADHIEVLVNTLLSNSKAVAAYCLAWEVVTDTTRLAEGEYAELIHNVPSVLRQEFDYEVLKHHNFMPIQSVLFERQLYEERGGLDEDLNALEDWVLWLRYAYGNRFVFVGKVTSMFRTPSDSAEIKQRRNAFDTAYSLALARASASVRGLRSSEGTMQATKDLADPSVVRGDTI